MNKPDCLLIACPSDHPFPNLPTGLICAATFISLPSSSQNCMGCGVRGLSVRNKTRKTLAERGSERILCKYVFVFMFHPPQLPAAHQNELRLSSGVWRVGQGRARWRHPRPQTPAFLCYPLFRGAGSWPPSHPPARIWGDFLLLLRAWVKRTAVHSAIELVPRGERRTAVRALSIFANVSFWSREGCITSKLGAPISTPTKSRSPLLYPH